MTNSIWRIGSLRREALCGLVAASLLTVGFLGYVTLAAAVATHAADPQTVGLTQRAFAVYARTLLVKGLLPQLGGTLVLFEILRRWLRPGFWPRNLSILVLCAVIAHVLVLSFLLSVDHPGMPAVKFVDAANRVRTLLEMTGAVVTAAVAARVAFYRRGRGGDAEEGVRS